jgi:hypothetical protein
MSGEEVDEAARESAYLDSITKRKQQKFASKVFGGGLEAAREGGGSKPIHHSPIQATPQPQPVQQPVRSPSYGAIKKTWNQPVEAVHHEPVNRANYSPVQYNYGQIDTTSMISKRNEEDVDEALRKEDERMTKKLSSTAPVGSVQVGGLLPAQQPESRKPSSQSFSPVSYKPTPVHVVDNSVYSSPQSSTGSARCSSCGTGCAQGTKFCPNCGTIIKQSPTSPIHGYQQSSAPTGVYGEIDQTPMTSKKDDADLEEALRREEERMNKKVSNTGSSGQFGGGSPVHQQPAHQPVYQPPVHQPIHQPVHQQSRPSYQIQDDVVEEIVTPIRNMAVSNMSGPGVFCTYDVPGNPNAQDERPKMNVDQTSSYLFTPAPGKLGCSIECLIEGSDVLKFKMTTTQNAVVVQKYSMPFPIGREHLKRRGDSIELDPF